ncbi:MAG: translation initiation factor IF-1 [Patescibacteria group bacterium]
MKEKSGKLVTGIVIEALPNTVFRVQLNEGQEIMAYLSGKMRINRIKVMIGDKVKIELGQYDETKGRIIQRL